MGTVGNPKREGDIKRRTGGRTARIRSAVLKEALLLIKSRGISGFSVADIARRSGVHETTIYRRWNGVEQLILETLLENATEKIPEQDTGSLRQDAIAMIGNVLEYCKSPTGALLLRVLVSVGEEAAELKKKYWQARMRVAERVVERAKERGELDRRVNGALLISALIAPIYFRLLVTGDPIEPDFPEKIVDLIFRKKSIS